MMLSAVDLSTEQLRRRLATTTSNAHMINAILIRREIKEDEMEEWQLPSELRPMTSIGRPETSKYSGPVNS